MDLKLKIIEQRLMKVEKGHHKIRDGGDAASFKGNLFSWNSEKRVEFTSVTFLTKTLIFFTRNLLLTY